MLNASYNHLPVQSLEPFEVKMPTSIHLETRREMLSLPNGDRLMFPCPASMWSAKLFDAGRLGRFLTGKRPASVFN